MPSEKQVILCQGDKKELEEITGKKYEHIKGEIMVQDSNSEPTYLLKGKNATFIKVKNRSIINAEENMLNIPSKYHLEIDAFIHYRLFKGDSTSAGDMYYAMGTPVRLKNKK